MLTYPYICVFVFFFFFQAEDGIRDYKVTGVQTCALPIYCGACCRLSLSRLPAPCRAGLRRAAGAPGRHNRSGPLGELPKAGKRAALPGIKTGRASAPGGAKQMEENRQRTKTKQKAFLMCQYRTSGAGQEPVNTRFDSLAGAKITGETEMRLPMYVRIYVRITGSER